MQHRAPRDHAGQAVSDYRSSHQPFADGPTLDRMDDMFGPDVYAHPEWWSWDVDGGGRGEATRALLAARGRPDAPVTIYRAVPPGVDRINPGDWVTTSEAYARQHAIQDDDPANDWPVVSLTVRAAEVRTGGSDIFEWGYFPA